MAKSTLKNKKTICVVCSKHLTGNQRKFCSKVCCYTQHNSLNKEIKKEQYLTNLSKNRELRKEYSEIFREKYPERRMYYAAKERSLKKDLPFDIKFEDIKIPELCPVFNVPLERKGRYAPSLDRIKPELGYVKGNIQVISLQANLMKTNSTEKELRSFANWVIKTFQP